MGVVDAGDGAGDAELGLGDLAEGQVVLVIAGDRDHQVGPLHAGPLHSGGIAGVSLHDHLVAQLLGDIVRARGVDLDDQDLVVGNEGAGEVESDLSGSGYDDEHGYSSGAFRMASRSSVASILVGLIVRSPNSR